MQFVELDMSVKFALLFSGIFLFVGMLTGVWKYAQIRHSPQFRAHYYVDIAHRSSLLYAPASLIIAVMAAISVWHEPVNMLFVGINLFFFSFSILSYIVHGVLQDTNNQFRSPHVLGKWTLPKSIMLMAMMALVVGEIVATLGLLWGMFLGLF